MSYYKSTSDKQRNFIDSLVAVVGSTVAGYGIDTNVAMITCFGIGIGVMCFVRLAARNG